MQNIKIIGTVSEIMLMNLTCSDIARIIVTGESESALADERGEYMCDIPADIARKLRLNTKVMVYGRVNPEHCERKWIVPAHVLELRILGSKEEKCIIGVVGRIEGELISNPTSDGMVKNFAVRCEGASDMLKGLGIRNGTCLLCEAPGNMADGLKIGDKIIANGVKDLKGKFVIEDIDAGILFQETVSIYSEDTTCKTVHLDMKRLDHFIDDWNRSGGEGLSESEKNELAANIVEFAERLFRNKYIEHDRINHAIEKLEAVDKLIRRSTIPVRTYRYLSREIDRFHVSLAKHVLKYDSESCANNGIGESASSIFWQYYSLYLMAAGLKRIKNVTFPGALFDEKMPLLNLTIKGAVVNIPILAELFNYCSQLTSGGPFMEPWPELLKEYRERHC